MEAYSKWTSTDELFHPPSPGASPLRDNQEDVLRDVRKEMVELSKKRKRKRNERPQPRETVKGNIGEIAAGLQFKVDRIPYVDANRVIAKSIAGIDHIINHGKFCFSQSKVHTDGSPNNLAKVYKAEIDQRADMVQLFIKKLVQRNKLAALREANTLIGNNPTLTAIIDELTTNWDEYAQDIGEIDSTMLAVQLATNAIIFPVPRDIYNAFETQYRAFAYKLRFDTTWFVSALRKSYYMNKKTKLSRKKREERDDPEFKL